MAAPTVSSHVGSQPLDCLGQAALPPLAAVLGISLPSDADDRCFELQYDASTTLAKLVHDLVLLAQLDLVGLGHYSRVPDATAYMFECLDRTANRPPPT